MTDDVFLITGASSGIGAETARHAAHAGYRLQGAEGQEQCTQENSNRQDNGDIQRHQFVSGPHASAVAL